MRWLWRKRWGYMVTYAVGGSEGPWSLRTEWVTQHWTSGAALRAAEDHIARVNGLPGQDQMIVSAEVLRLPPGMDLDRH